MLKNGVIRKKRRGRPREEGARRNRVKVLLNENEYEMLKDASKKHNISCAEIIRRGITLGISDLDTKFIAENEDDYPDWDFMNDYSDEEEDDEDW